MRNREKATDGLSTGMTETEMSAKTIRTGKKIGTGAERRETTPVKRANPADDNATTGIKVESVTSTENATMLPDMRVTKVAGTKDQSEMIEEISVTPEAVMNPRVTLVTAKEDVTPKRGTKVRKEAAAEEIKERTVTGASDATKKKATNDRSGVTKNRATTAMKLSVTPEAIERSNVRTKIPDERGPKAKKDRQRTEDLRAKSPVAESKAKLMVMMAEAAADGMEMGR